jgi:tetratricopeptide (TPR) repeat protein
MRTWIVILVVALVLPVLAQDTAAQAPTQSAASAAASSQPAPPQQKKEIKSQQEYTAYVNAIQQTDDKAKAAHLEGYLQQYPDSVVKVDALELLMATYQSLGNLPKVLDTANRLLQLDPSDLRALALMAYVKRSQAEQPGGGATAQQNLTEAANYGQRGLQAVQTAPKPESMKPADFDNLKAQTSAIFNGAIGIAALQNKDYANAQQALQASVNVNPANLNDVYPLALAYLQAPQPNYPQGLWYIARAAGLAAQNAAAQLQFAKYGRSAYIKYHGNDQGWNDLLKLAAANPTPPADFKIAPRPTPADEADEIVKSTPVKDMTFDQFQLIFTSGNQKAADAVWADLKDKVTDFQATVVSATAKELKLAATADDIDKKVADVTLIMIGPIPLRLIPKAGSTIQVEGTPESVTPQPFMIKMVKGQLLSAEKPSAAPKKHVNH